MTVEEKYKLIKKYEEPLNEIVKVIEIIDPIRNDTKANHYKSHRDPRVTDGTEMVRIPSFKSWLIKTKNTLLLRVRRDNGYTPIELELSFEVIDSISKTLCEKRDWLREQIKQINEIG
jgi:hypothetical protein